MKRVKAACICQTLCFSTKDEVDRDCAARLAREEAEQYKKSLKRNQTQYKIIEEAEQADGSLVMKVIKQYNTSPVGDYLD